MAKKKVTQKEKSEAPMRRVTVEINYKVKTEGLEKLNRLLGEIDAKHDKLKSFLK